MRGRVPQFAKAPAARAGLRAGFTLLEIVIVLTVAGILIGIAAPSLARAHRRHAAYAAGRTLRADVAQARLKAILEGATVRVVIDTLAARYRVEDSARTVWRERALPEGLVLRTTAYRQEVLFSARGTSNLYSTTWIGVGDDPEARSHGVRVIPTGAIEAR